MLSATASWAAGQSGGASPPAAAGEAKPVAAAVIPPAPIPASKPFRREIHGRVMEDPFFWLRERENPEVIAHLKAENAYSDAMLAHTKGLQERLYNEMLGRIKQTDDSVPYPRDGWWYITRFIEGQEHAVYVRRKGGPDGPEQVLLDENLAVKDQPNGSASVVTVSPDTRLIAWGLDPTGGRRLTIRFKDMETGKDLPEVIENASGDIVFANDNRTVFYVTLDHALRSDKVWRLKLGEPGAKPELVHHETDERFVCGLSRPLNKKVILLTLFSMKTTEVRFVPADQPGGEFRVIEPRRQGIEYSVDHRGDRFYILHNEGAMNFTLASAPVESPGRANWTTVIPHRSDVFLQDVTSMARHMVITGRQNGLPVIRVVPFGEQGPRMEEEHTIQMPEVSYALSPATNAEYDTDEFRFVYQSPVTPRSTFAYDMKARTRTLLKEQPVLGGYDRTRYTVERKEARASDGETIPITIVFRNDVKRDGSAPALLEGYGSYGFSSDADFSSMQLSLLDRGLVLATAHIRGGSEKGRGWYEAGRMMNKRNTFTDFIAAADFLIQNGYTSPARLAIRGGSAGGLLMGAVTNMRPELFRAVVADVPFVDMMNTMLDDDLPLTVIEYEQWGNPKEKDAFEYMMTYSPYDNVKKLPYPDVFALVGFHDSNVPYWEGAKWVAKLRQANVRPNATFLLHTNLDAGHGGTSGRYGRLREEALRYAFILDRLGVRSSPSDGDNTK